MPDPRNPDQRDYSQYTEKEYYIHLEGPERNFNGMDAPIDCGKIGPFSTIQAAENARDTLIDWLFAWDPEFLYHEHMDIETWLKKP